LAANPRNPFAVITKGHSIDGIATTGRTAPAKHIDYALFGFKTQSPFLRQSLEIHLLSGINGSFSLRAQSIAENGAGCNKNFTEGVVALYDI
jgi:hypothetical protein